MTRRSAWWIPVLFLSGTVALLTQEPPRATELPNNAVSIKQTWFLGGTGNWDYLTMDPVARRLYIAHGHDVQVVDIESGALAGEIGGLKDAHDIALDASGEFGYISDGAADEVKIFDRRSLQVVASIPTGPTPRALALDAQTGLLFAICTNPASEGAPTSRQGSGTNPRRTAAARPAGQNAERDIKTSISVIDLVSRKRVGEILMPGRLGFAQSDDNGGIFVLLVNRDQVARLDAEAVSALVRKRPDSGASVPQARVESGPAQTGSAEAGGSNQNNAAAPGQAGNGEPPVIVDWSHESRPAESSQDALRVLSLGGGCQQPLSLAVDGTHQRLFAACNNMKLTVLNAGSGEVVTSLPIGPGADTVGYDAARGLIYTANGGAQGSLTVIRQDVTDTYAEIQNLPTRQRARTLAINPDTGQVYLVTDFQGVNVARPGGIGTLKAVPVEGSFQVLVIGH